MPARTEAVRSFLRDGGSLCPYAASAERAGQVQYLELAPGYPGLRAHMLEAAFQFAGTANVGGAHALLVLTPNDLPFDEAKERAHMMFMELALAFGRVTYPVAPVTDLAGHLRRNIEPYLADPIRFGRFFIGCKDKPLYTIGFGPQYPVEGPRHPRHAPHTLLSMTWHHELAAVPPESVEMIRARMLAAAGCLYDADELWLPLCPASGFRQSMLLGEEQA